MNSWGTTVNHTHFKNESYQPPPNPTETQRMRNVYHYESRAVFRMIGDTEYVSGSTEPIVGEQLGIGYIPPCNNIHDLKSRMMVDQGKGYTYTSFVTTNINPNSSSNSNYSVGSNQIYNIGKLDGRMMGKTNYYLEVSGTLYYPSNHVSRFPTVSETMGLFEGTQNINPGRYNLYRDDGTVLDDISPAAFYRVKIAGKNVLKVDRGGDVIDSTGKRQTRK